MDSKSERNQTIINMYNSGETIKTIAGFTKMSNGGIHKIISSHLETTQATEVPDIEIKETVKSGIIFNSFVGWLRIGINQYSNKDTGEVVNVKFVPSGNILNCGHFVTI